MSTRIKIRSDVRPLYLEARQQAVSLLNQHPDKLIHYGVTDYENRNGLYWLYNLSRHYYSDSKSIRYEEHFEYGPIGKMDGAGKFLPYSEDIYMEFNKAPTLESLGELP